MTWYGIHDDRDPPSDEEYRKKLISLYLMRFCWSNGKTKGDRPEVHTKEHRNKAIRYADKLVAARKKLDIVRFQKELKRELNELR